MNLDILFLVSNLVVMPFWALMILMPHWRWTQRLLGGVWPVLIPAGLYAILLLPEFAGVGVELLNPSLSGVAALLGTPTGALLGWVHFLAFDLFIGRWVYLDSRTRQISAWLASPALFLVLMVGPLGFLLYVVLRRSWLMLRPQPVEVRG